MKIRYYYDIGDDAPSKYASEADAPWCPDFVFSEAAKHTPSWFKSLATTVDEDKTLKFCPSFLNHFQNGFVVRNHTDLHVSLKDGQVNLQSKSDDFPHIHVHEGFQFGDNYPFPVGYLPASVKFLSPYTFVAPRDMCVMVQPCWWSDSANLVSAIPGLLKVKKGCHFKLNINTFVKAPADDYVISALTPLAQVFFFDSYEPSFVMEQDLSSTKDAKWWRRRNQYFELRRSIITPMKRVSDFLIKRKK